MFVGMLQVCKCGKRIVSIFACGDQWSIIKGGDTMFQNIEANYDLSVSCKARLKWPTQACISRCGEWAYYWVHSRSSCAPSQVEGLEKQPQGCTWPDGSWRIFWSWPTGRCPTHGGVHGHSGRLCRVKAAWGIGWRSARLGDGEGKCQIAPCQGVALRVGLTTWVTGLCSWVVVLVCIKMLLRMYD